ncbi:hypothetical protein [Dactylosporangium darangshiense]|uniref:Uncharacterized protein n=1 Tax=Dactylosporangium darangshiense TaxID=579108 RepID=A0ABP8DFF3_9ACTN
MSEAGRRARAALPAVALLVLATGAMLALSTLLGFAPLPAAWRIALTLVVAVLLALAAADQVRAALTDWQGASAAESGVHRRPRRNVLPQPNSRTDPDRSGEFTGERTETGIFTGRTRPVPTTDELWGASGEHTRPVSPAPESAEERRPERPKPRRPSWVRLAVTVAAALVLAALLWVPQVPVHGLAVRVTTFLLGYAAYALPVLPLLLAWPLPRLPREPWPWRLALVPVADRRMWNGGELRHLGTATLALLRERVLTRATGVVVAALGLLHLVRGNPDVLDGGAARAGGLAGYLIAEPLRLLLSGGGAIAVLGGVLASAAAITAASAGRAWGTVTGYTTLALSVVAPLGAVGAGHWLGYEYYLRTENGHVVVVAGLSPTHRQAVHDTKLSVEGLSPSLRQLFADGLPVSDYDDGDRIAKALAAPATSAAESYAGEEFDLRTGECFDWIGGSSQLRYVAQCNAAHVGEVTFVGHLPFTVNPGSKAVAAASQAMCEQSYGDYLGVPFGQSFLPLEKPLLPPGLEAAWHAKPVIACWLGSVGPWPLKGTKTVAALQQKAAWGPAGGCKIEVPDALRVTAEQPNARCLAPGPEQRLSVPGGGFAIDLEFAAIGKGAGGARIGAGCYDGANLANGYSFEVNADGVIEIYKHAGDQHPRVAASAKPKNAGPPTTASTPLQVSCKPTADGGVELTAFSTGNRKASFVDKDHPFTSLSPRLVLTNAGTGGVVMTTMIFNATRV